MYAVKIFILQQVFLLTVEAWFTGPNGKQADEGTPEFVANQYLNKLFEKYGLEPRIGDEMGEEVLSKLMHGLGLGIIHEIPEDHFHEDNDVNDKEHRRKRSTSKTYADAVWRTPHGHKDVSEVNNTNCLSAPLLINNYGLSKRVTRLTGIGPYEFGLICPTLIYLSDDKSCISHEKGENTKPSTSTVWGYGFLSITIISALSMLGVLITPCLSKSFFNSILSVLVAQAIGALCGDAMLHLIPHAQSTSHEHSKEAIYKNLMVLFGIYVLFVVEGVLKLIQSSKRKKKQQVSENVVKQCDNTIVRITGEGQALVDATESDVKIETRQSMDVNGDRIHSHSHARDHGDMSDKGIASMAWMVIAGDGMHNFSDGIAIGAAFSLSIIGGLSTSLAVFCHELPHELGDFAMLIKSGMTVKQALFYNGVAACLAYFGLIVGILIGNYAASFTPWIFACTAGMFLYVALVDMLPELNSGMEKRTTKASIQILILQNIGIVVGTAVMYLITVYEGDIEIGE